MKTIYLQLADQFREDQIDPFEVVKQVRRCELKALRSQGISHVRVLVNMSDCCDSCRDLNGQRFLLRKALVVNPVPANTCKFDRREGVVAPGWCRCSYVAA